MASQDSATSSAAIKVNATAPHTSASVHLLPCCIDHQGGARVSTFFRAEQTDEGGAWSTRRPSAVWALVTWRAVK